MRFRTKVVAATLASAAVLGLSQIPGSPPEPGFEQKQVQKVLDEMESQDNWDRETISIPPDEWGRGDFKAAQDYADWCGGEVEDAPGGPYVINCDE